MKSSYRFIFVVVLCLGMFAGNAVAQFKNGQQATELMLPTISQHGVVTQTIGITTVTIDYHRPLTGGREVFGKVVPYGKVWRAGANENTTIAFSDDVTIEGKPLAAGKYGLHMIPDKDQWTIIFSKNSTSWGSFSYDEAANWCLDNNYNLEQALKWENTSIQNEDRFENLETKSRILNAMGQKDEAAKTLNAAFEKANAQQLYVYARGLQRSGNANRAFELYPMVVKKDPNHWLAHLAQARISSKAGDFSTASKEMKLAIAGSPDANKPFLEPLQAKLDSKQDINN